MGHRAHRRSTTWRDGRRNSCHAPHFLLQRLSDRPSLPHLGRPPPLRTPAGPARQGTTTPTPPTSSSCRHGAGQDCWCKALFPCAAAVPAGRPLERRRIGPGLSREDGSRRMAQGERDLRLPCDGEAPELCRSGTSPLVQSGVRRGGASDLRGYRAPWRSYAIAMGGSKKVRRCELPGREADCGVLVRRVEAAYGRGCPLVVARAPLPRAPFSERLRG